MRRDSYRVGKVNVRFIVRLQRLGFICYINLLIYSVAIYFNLLTKLQLMQYNDFLDIEVISS